MEALSSSVIHTLHASGPKEFCRLVYEHYYKSVVHCINNAEYHTFKIRKKRGGQREICAPTGDLLRLQKRLNSELQEKYNTIKPEAVHGFVRMSHTNNFGIISNAAAHVNKPYLLNIDLKDFFPSVSATRVKHLFCGPYFKLDEQTATLLTLLLTWKGSLPIGAPTSPVISNFICLGLDKKLSLYASMNGLNYTRYADDLSFSSSQKMEAGHITAITEIILSEKFHVNQKKVRLHGPHSSRTVTGIKVNEKTNIDRRYIRNLRAIFHSIHILGADHAALKYFGVGTHTHPDITKKFLKSLKGKIEFVGMVRGKEDGVYERLREEYEKLF